MQSQGSKQNSNCAPERKVSNAYTGERPKKAYVERGETIYCISYPLYPLYLSQLTVVDGRVALMCQQRWSPPVLGFMLRKLVHRSDEIQIAM